MPLAIQDNMTVNRHFSCPVVLTVTVLTPFCSTVKSLGRSKVRGVWSAFPIRERGRFKSLSPCYNMLLESQDFSSSSSGNFWVMWVLLLRDRLCRPMKRWHHWGETLKLSYFNSFANSFAFNRIDTVDTETPCDRHSNIHSNIFWSISG